MAMPIRPCRTSERTTVAAGLHPWPADAEAVGLRADAGHERDILGKAVIVVTRVVPGLAVRDRAGHASERVPDGAAPTVLGCRTFDLVRGGRESPGEPR